MMDKVAAAKQTGRSKAGSADLKRLRKILLGKDYQELLALKQQLNNPQQHSEKVAAIVSEALEIRAKQDSSLSKILSPTVEGALIDSIERDPKRLANALYPVMGPAIRKSINEVLTQTIETFNQLLEQSLTPRSLLWRFDAWRSGKQYAEVMLLNTLEYQVEQVFLIHSETGLLLRHVVLPDAMSKDPDMVSGMLTAIQDFIADSFGVQHGDTLHHMRLGELTVLVEQGPYAVIAAVVRGNTPTDLSALLRRTSEDIHQQMNHTLQTYTGDSEPFARIHPLLTKCLLAQAQEKKKGKPWFNYLLFGIGLLAISYWGYQAYQIRQATQQASHQEQQWQRLLAAFAAEPGLVIVETNVEANTDGRQRSIHGLADPLARPPAAVLESLSIGSIKAGEVNEADGIAASLQTSLNFTPYISAEPVIAQKRAQKFLQPPASVQLRVENNVLVASGRADYQWHERLQSSWAMVAGVTALNTAALAVSGDPDLSQLKKITGLIQAVENMRHHFRSAQEVIGAADRQELVQQARRIRQLIGLAKEQKKLLQVVVFGNIARNRADGDGYAKAMQRAHEIRQQLMMFGVPGVVLTAIVNKYEDTAANSVGYQVNLY